MRYSGEVFANRLWGESFGTYPHTDVGWHILFSIQGNHAIGGTADSDHVYKENCKPPSCGYTGAVFL